jgi:hypothetical protein
MAKRPEGDLGSMAISKAKAVETVPFGSAPQPAPVTGPAATKSLTVKLEVPLYYEMKEFCHKREVSTGRRLSHQDAMIEGLRMLLATGQPR